MKGVKGIRSIDIHTHTNLTIILLAIFIAIGAVNYHISIIDSSYLYWIVGAVLCMAFLAAAVKYRASPRKSVILITLGVLTYTALDYSVVSVKLIGDVFSTIFLSQTALVIVGYGCIYGYYLGYGHNLVRLMLVNIGVIGCQALAVINEMFMLDDVDNAYQLFIATLPDLFIRLSLIIYLARPEFSKIAIDTRLKTHLAREFHLVLVCAFIFALVLAEEELVFLYPDLYLFGNSIAWDVIGGITCWAMLAMAIYFKDQKRRSAVLMMTGVMIYTALSYKVSTDITGDLWNLFYSAQAVLVNFCVILSFACIFGYYLGYVHNITRMVMLTGIVIALVLSPWWVWRYIEHDLEIAEEVFKLLLPSVMIRVLMLSYLVRPDIIDMSIGAQLKMRLNRVESTQLMDNMSFMEREDMDMLLNPDGPGWTVLPEGPVERLCAVSITTSNKRHYRIVARIWRGEDFIRCKLSPEKDTRGSWGMDFDIVSHRFYTIEGKDIVRIYGHDGMFVDIYTENPRIHRENKISDALDRIIREY